MSKKKKEKEDKRKKLCLISSSGGHYEELLMLKGLAKKYDIFIVTEKVDYKIEAKYSLYQTGLKDFWWIIKMFVNFFKTLRIFHKEKPDVVITTGTMIAIPMCMLAKIFKKKVVYIESYSRVHDCTRTGKFLYKHADLFIYQWEELEKFYPKGIYGGSIY